MGWLLVAVVVFLWFLTLGALYLQGRYRYSRRSRAVLIAEAPVALGVSYGLSRWLFPGWEGAVRTLVAVALSLPVYLGMAIFTVEAWRRRLQRHLDLAILRLEAEESRCEEALQALEAQARAALRARAAPEAGAEEAPSRPLPAASAREPSLPRRPDEHRWLETVEEWERKGGQARVRSLRVLEWREELAGMSLARLGEEERRLEALLPEAGDRREQVEVRLALVRLALAERRRAEAPAETQRAEAPAERRRSTEAPAGPPLAAGPDGRRAPEPPAPETLRSKRAELERLRAELAEWRRRREEFLSRRIPLE
ncbi:MAG: hypothetical protein K6T75_01260 [Acetobacteraceae bacterium]|nr:hypothetical protein [Acetobacteraceae bacterium]